MALPLAPSALALTLASVALTLGCSVDGADFDDAFNSDSSPQSPAPEAEEPADEDEDADADAEDEPAPEPTDDPPAPTGFQHEGTFIGTCTMEGREAFQVDMQLDQWGRGFLRRHDLGPMELDAAGLSTDGVTTVEAVWGDLLFVVNIHEDAEGMDAECLELQPTEGEGDGIECMFTQIGCPHAETSWEIVAAGDLELQRT